MADNFQPEKTFAVSVRGVLLPERFDTFEQAAQHVKRTGNDEKSATILRELPSHFLRTLLRKI